MAVLLSESASLTSRETLTVLGRSGRRADVLTAQSLSLSRFSRWRGRLIHAPSSGRDPRGYLAVVADLLATGRYEAVLPTHEQAWLFAAGRHLLPDSAPVAVAPLAAFERVHSKIEFAVLCDELGLPQPPWWRDGERTTDQRFPYWLKASHGTAGRSVRLVGTAEQERTARRALSSPGEGLMGQLPAPGQYGQTQALFEHGRLIAAHSSVQVGRGAGGSAAARLSVDHPEAREYLQLIGARLNWHGGITLDYLHVDGHPQLIECNVRTVEPGNAAAAGVDLPALAIALAAGQPLPAQPVIGRPGIRTRSAMALALGTAESTGSRLAVLRSLGECALSLGANGQAAEVLTPIRRDPPTLIPLGVVVAQLLIRPGSVARIARGAVDDYAVPVQAVDALRSR